MERVACGGRGGVAGGRVGRSGIRPRAPLEGDIERPPRDGARPHDPDWWLLVAIVALVVFGTVMIFSATFARDLPEGGDPLRFLRKQLLWVVLGGSAFLVTMRIDYHLWRHFSVVALLGAILLLMLVLVPGLGVGADEVGARRWLNLGPLPQFQPSELAKAAVVLFLADWLTT